jgi:hypothetical protein
MSKESRAFFTAAGRFVSSENRVKILSALRLEAEEEKKRRVGVSVDVGDRESVGGESKGEEDIVISI